QLRVFELSQAEEAPALRSFAGHKIWNHANTEDKQSLALQFGLITDQTSAILVYVSTDGAKAKTLPQITKVPHMIPAGMVTSTLEVCAQFDLPAPPLSARRSGVLPAIDQESEAWHAPEENILNLLTDRSEERRVGKESRGR